MAGAISMLANRMIFGGRDSDGPSANPLVGLLVALLAPLAASLIQMAISRARSSRPTAAAPRSPTAMAGLGAGRSHPAPARIPMAGLSATRDSADDDHEPAVRRRARGLFSITPTEGACCLLAMARRGGA